MSNEISLSPPFLPQPGHGSDGHPSGHRHGAAGVGADRAGRRPPVCAPATGGPGRGHPDQGPVRLCLPGEGPNIMYFQPSTGSH